MQERPRVRARDWFPFSATEVQVALGLCGFLATMLSVLGLASEDITRGAGTFLAVTYVAGLLVHARAGRRTFDLVVNGGLRGTGYLPFFRTAKRSLFLTHVDDDTPCEELLGVYRSLLERGVQMRRVVFRRGKESGTRWLVEFGEHKNLRQRVVPPEHAELMALSFAVVDENAVVVSVPGYGAIDGEPYTPDFVLKHLLVLRDHAVARVFLEIHRQLWDQAKPLERAEELLEAPPQPHPRKPR